MKRKEKKRERERESQKGCARSPIQKQARQSSPTRANRKKQEKTQRAKKKSRRPPKRRGKKGESHGRKTCTMGCPIQKEKRIQRRGCRRTSVVLFFFHPRAASLRLFLLPRYASLFFRRSCL